MKDVLTGKRVLVTQAGEFMGPVLCEVFAEQGATVLAPSEELSEPSSAARGAQLAYVQAVGVEFAPHSLQVNAIAQNFVDNPTYFPPEVQANPRFRERLAREVPLGRLVAAREDAQFAAYLCSTAADCFVGQVFPVCGGWVGR